MIGLFLLLNQRILADLVFGQLDHLPQAELIQPQTEVIRLLHAGILVERNNARIGVGTLCLGGRGFLHKRLSQHGRHA